MKFLSFLLLIVFLFGVHCKTVNEDDTSSAVNELKIEIVRKSQYCAQKARFGDVLWIHYNGTFTDGTQFDTR